MRGSIIRILGILVVTSISTLFGQTVLSGDLSAFVFDSSKNPFVVDKDVEIPPKKSVTINEGCVFLFSEFSGIKVSGTLVVNGTKEHPVIFTSHYDSLYDPKSKQQAAPFDWNGLLIDKDCDSLIMNNFQLKYSVYGVKSQKQHIVLKNGMFHSNGQFNFTIFDKIQYVQDNLPFSFPNDSASVQIGSQKNSSQTILSISSTPASAEIYLNKKPGKRVKPDGITPATFSNPVNASVSLTLFKKGYQDTAQLLSIKPNAMNNFDFSLSPVRQESIKAQDKILNDRFHMQIGRYCFYTSPVFLVIGGGLLYFAGKNQDLSDDAKSYMDKSMLPSDPKINEMQNQYTSEKSKAIIKRGFAVGSFVFAAAALGVGFYFSF